MTQNSINTELADQNIMNAHQHGIMENRACQTDLISIFDEITSFVDNGNCVDATDLGFCKAFDLMPHDMLIKKNYCFRMSNGIMIG